MGDNEDAGKELWELLAELRSEGLSATEEANYASGHCLVLLAILDDEIELAKDSLIDDISAFYASSGDREYGNENLEDYIKAVRHQIVLLSKRIPRLAEQINGNQ